MKQFILFTLILCTGLIMSCSSDSDEDMNEPDPIENTIEGEWALVDIDIDIFETNDFGATFVHEGRNNDLEDDFILKIESGEWSSMGKYELATREDQAVTTIFDYATYEGIDKSGTYTEVDSTLTINKTLFDFGIAGVTYTDHSQAIQLDYTFDLEGNLFLNEVTVKGMIEFRSESKWTKK